MWPPYMLPPQGRKRGRLLEAGGVLHSLVWGVWGEVAAYKGEMGKTFYTRGLEHLEALENRSEDKSVLCLHSVHHRIMGYLFLLLLEILLSQ